MGRPSVYSECPPMQDGSGYPHRGGTGRGPAPSRRPPPMRIFASCPFSPPGGPACSDPPLPRTDRPDLPCQIRHSLTGRGLRRDGDQRSAFQVGVLHPGPRSRSEPRFLYWSPPVLSSGLCASDAPTGTAWEKGTTAAYRPMGVSSRPLPSGRARIGLFFALPFVIHNVKIVEGEK